MSVCLVESRAVNRSDQSQKLYNIVALQGEFCGTEVINVGNRLLDAVSRWTGSQFSIQSYNISNEVLAENDGLLPPHMIEECKKSDSVLLGGFCGLRSVNGDRLQSYSTMFKALRKDLGLYWQLTPAASYFPRTVTEQAGFKKSIDLAFVRELASGIYHGPQGREELDDGQVIERPKAQGACFDTLSYQSFLSGWEACAGSRVFDLRVSNIGD